MAASGISSGRREIEKLVAKARKEPVESGAISSSRKDIAPCWKACIVEMRVALHPTWRRYWVRKKSVDHEYLLPFVAPSELKLD